MGPGDVLEVAVDGRPDLSRLPTVQTTGRVWLPRAGEVEVRGLTTDEIAARVAPLLAGEDLPAPRVSVRVREYHSQFVWVRGAVLRPGRKPLRSGSRLVDALLDAGGFQPGASGEVTVERASGTLPDGSRSATFRFGGSPTPEELEHLSLPLEPGDVITAGIQRWVTVSGAVRKPGRYPFEQRAHAQPGGRGRGRPPPDRQRARDPAAARRRGRGRPRRDPRRQGRGPGPLARRRGGGQGPPAVSTSAHVPRPGDVDPGAAPRDFEVRYYAELLWRRRILLAAAAIGGLALGILAGELQVPRYQARTLLQVMPPNPTSLTVTDALVQTGNPMRDRQFFNTQLNVLHSRAIAERVVDKLKLKDQPGFQGAGDAGRASSSPRSRSSRCPRPTWSR